MSTTTKEFKRPRSGKEPFFVSKPERTIEWLGGVNYDNERQATQRLRELMMEDGDEEICLVINSYGGATAIGLSFHDVVKSVLKPNLVTVGSGEVDSSGLLVFLAGSKRYLTKNTTMLLHLGGRTLEDSQRFSTAEIEGMLKEMRLKDYQYACLAADATEGRCTPERLLELMSKDTILSAEEAVNLGLAHKVLA